MGVTLDTGALAAFQECLANRTHPLSEHVFSWDYRNVGVSTPAVAWAEYWRGRSSNVHFVAQVRKQLRIEVVTQEMGEFAADVLRQWPVGHKRNSVKHLVDAIVMAQADSHGNTVYTADVADFEPLWDRFENVKALVSAVSGEVIRTR